MDLAFILLFLESIPLQFDFFGEAGHLGSDDPMIKGIILSMFAVSGFGILLNIFNSGVRKKMVDQVKLKRIMKETRAWQKERMAAMRSKDQDKMNELGKKICVHEQDVHGNDANEHATYDDNFCSLNFDILSCIASIVFIYSCTIPNPTECYSW